MKWFHKAFSLFLAVCILLSAGSFQVQAVGTAVQDNSQVRLIVEMEEDAVLASAEARALGAVQYAGTDRALAQGQRLAAAQQSVQNTIQRRVNADAQVAYTYTNVFNGFSLDATRSDIDAIKAIDGVKNVYISGQIKLTDPVETDDAASGEQDSGLLSCCEEIDVSYMHENGYDGRGQVIAVIDSELDVNHEFFASAVETPKLTQEAIKTLLEENEFNVNVTAKRVYHSSKLPFVYDYYNDSTDTYDPANVHGTHVTGIAAGKNGMLEDMEFSGVAPEAQVVFMKVSDENGYIDLATTLAAFDDAAKLGVCAINASFGSIYEHYYEPYETAITNLQEAGILLSAAAGNSGRGLSEIAYADMPDYDTSGMPGSTSASLTVASSEAPDMVILRYRVVLGGSQTEEFSSAGDNSGFMETFSEAAYPYVDCGRATAADVEDLDLTGKIAVVLRDVPEIEEKITFTEKAQNVERKGAVGIIFVNYDEELITPLTETDLPFMMVTRSFGDTLLAQKTQTIQTDPVPVTVVEENPERGVSSFSAWGTNQSLELKPEITAPAARSIPLCRMTSTKQ